ncbi:hypothetical protein V492_04151 [Pseudogymnoascus sp. VKM F-4246]|nr:hypothetical protein V492_04151 [Pseudogymnoascus sp. VKM F-4246]
MVGARRGGNWALAWLGLVRNTLAGTSDLRWMDNRRDRNITDRDDPSANNVHRTRSPPPLAQASDGMAWPDANRPSRKGPDRAGRPRHAVSPARSDQRHIATFPDAPACRTSHIKPVCMNRPPKPKKKAATIATQSPRYYVSIIARCRQQQTTLHERQGANRPADRQTGWAAGARAKLFWKTLIGPAVSFAGGPWNGLGKSETRTGQDRTDNST